jgi:hypothetical protein
MPDVASPLRIASQWMVDSNQLTGPGVKAKPVLATNSGFADFGGSDRLSFDHSVVLDVGRR